MGIIAKAPSRLLVLLVMISVLSLLLLASAVQATSTLRSTEEYRVTSGDRLWDIAAEVTEPGEDVRDTLGAIKRMNGLESSLLQPGQVLIVPSGG